jgi:iron complex outermembrane receptor protein
VDFRSEHHDIESVSRIDAATGATSQVTPIQHQQMENGGLYAQWSGQWHPLLHTTLSYRADHHEQYRQQQSWRAALVVPWSERHNLKLIYGTAFQAPSPELLFRTPVQTGDIRGNPDLKPQLARTLELVFTGEINAYATYGVTGFYTDVTDLVRYHDEFQSLVARNSAKGQVRGVELELSWQDEHWRCYANLSYQQARYDAVELTPYRLDEDSELFPSWMGNAGILYRPMPDWGIGLDNQYSYDRQASASNVASSEASYRLDQFLDTSLILFHQVAADDQHDLRIQFQVKDLWNERYAQPGFGGIDVPTLGRRYVLGLQLRL